MKKETKWIKVLDDASVLQENRVMTVTANHTDICLSRFEGAVCALDNKCPHQGAAAFAASAYGKLTGLKIS